MICFLAATGSNPVIENNWELALFTLRLGCNKLTLSQHKMWGESNFTHTNGSYLSLIPCLLPECWICRPERNYNCVQFYFSLVWMVCEVAATSDTTVFECLAPGGPRVLWLNSVSSAVAERYLGVGEEPPCLRRSGNVAVSALWRGTNTSSV